MSSLETKNPRDALASLHIPRSDKRRRKSPVRRLWKLILLVLVLAGIGSFGFALWQKHEWAAQTVDWVPEAIRARTIVQAELVDVETGRTADALVVATGYIESFRQAKIGARAAGRIESLLVEEGSRVATGEVIAILDHKDIDAALAAAKAGLARAEAELGENKVEIEQFKKNFDRILKLRNSRTLSESEFDQAYFQHQSAIARRDTLEAAIVQAEARVQETEQFKENMIVRAPFDGTVISKDAEVGESILPGGMGEASGRGSVVTIADLDRLEVDCDVKEDYISRVSEGSEAEVAVDAVPDRRYKGRVRKIIPMGDRARATIKVKVEILNADERLFPDMSATVHFLPAHDPNQTPVDSNQKRMFCDSAAIVSTEDDTFVWILDGDLLVDQISVVVGAERDGRTEILEGLSGNERVIVNPPEELRIGEKVKLRE